MLKFFGGASLALAAAAVFAGPAAAAVVYDNLGAGSSGADPVNAFGPLADSFSTGAGGFNLSGVALLLSGQPDGEHFTVSLLADNGSSAVIATTGPVVDSVLTSSLSVVDFALSAHLAANTRYWIQVSTPDGGSANWSWSYDTSGPGVAGEYYFNKYGVFGNTGAGPYQMALLSGAVPEPETWAMMVLGVAMIGFAARRRREETAVAA